MPSNFAVTLRSSGRSHPPVPPIPILANPDAYKVYGSKLMTALITTTVTSFIPLNQKTFYGVSYVNETYQLHTQQPHHPHWLIGMSDINGMTLWIPNESSSYRIIATDGSRQEIHPLHVFSMFPFEGPLTITSPTMLTSDTIPNTPKLIGLEYATILRSLNLQDISLTEDDVTIIFQLTSLERLQLSDTDLTSFTCRSLLHVPTEAVMPKLQWLDIGSSQIKEIYPFSALRYLNMTGTPFSTLTNISKMQKLEHLNISCITMPAPALCEFVLPPALQIIVFQNYSGEITSLFQPCQSPEPMNVYQPFLPGSPALRWQQNTHAPSRVRWPIVYPNVLYLDFSSLAVSILSPYAFVKTFPNLRELCLSSNDYLLIRFSNSIRTITIDLRSLHNLQFLLRLDLSGMLFQNNDQTPLVALETLLALEVLNLTNCIRLTSLVGLEKLIKLRKLMITNTKIITTQPIKDLPNLTYFDSSQNTIQELMLPSCMRVLKLSDLRAYIPAPQTVAIENLEHLISLNLDSPLSLAQLPPNYSWLLNLKSLHNGSLEQLSLRQTAISQVDFDKLFISIFSEGTNSKLQDLRVAELYKVQHLPQVILQSNNRTEFLTRLSLRSIISIKNEDLSLVGRLFPKLLALNIAHCVNIDDFSPLFLLLCLESLIITGTKITEQQLYEVVQNILENTPGTIPPLKVLDAQACPNIPVISRCGFFRHPRNEKNLAATCIIMIEEEKLPKDVIIIYNKPKLSFSAYDYDDDASLSSIGVVQHPLQF